MEEASGRYGGESRAGGVQQLLQIQAIRAPSDGSETWTKRRKNLRPSKEISGKP